MISVGTPSMSDRSRLLDRPDGWRVVSWRRPRIGNAGFARAGTATKVTSIPSRSYRGIQPLQFYAGIGGGEVPIGFDLFFCSAVLPGGDPRPGSACWKYADRATDPTIRSVRIQPCPANRRVLGCSATRTFRRACRQPSSGANIMNRLTVPIPLSGAHQIKDARLWPRLGNACGQARHRSSSTRSWRVPASVSTPVSRAPAISQSRHPSPGSEASAFSRMRALVSCRYGCLPARISVLSRSPSSSLSHVSLLAKLFRGHEASPSLRSEQGRDLPQNQ